MQWLYLVIIDIVAMFVPFEVYLSKLDMLEAHHTNYSS